jgi:hypothetical protein
MGEDAPYPTLVATQHQAAGFGGCRSFAAPVAKARLAGSWALCSTAKENFRDLMRPLAWADNARMKMWFPRRSDGSATGQDDRALRIEKVDILDSERRAIASRNAGEGDVLDERLERNCHTGNIAFAVGGK